MDPSITIRPFQPNDADYEAVAQLNALAPAGERQDYEPRSSDTLRRLDGSFDAGHMLRRHVAEVARTGKVVGAAHSFRVPWSPDPGRFWCAVRCAPEVRRRGIGGRLYARVMEDLRCAGATAAWMMAKETMPEIATLLERRGYRELLRSWDLELEVDRFDTGRVKPTERLMGIVIEALPDVVRRDPAWLGSVHALYVEVMRDVPLPGVPRADPAPQWLLDHLLRWPTSLSEGCFVARDGDRYVGLTVLHRNDEDRDKLDHLLTGVAAGYRGRGIGIALKLATIEWARRHGYRRIWAGAESNNPAILALNEAFGYVKTGGLILFEAKL